MMLGTGMVALERVTRLADWADALGAWSLEAWNGLKAAMHPSIHRIRNQAGAMIAAHNVASWLEGLSVPTNHAPMCRIRIRSVACRRCTVLRGTLWKASEPSSKQR